MNYLNQCYKRLFNATTHSKTCAASGQSVGILFLLFLLSFMAQAENKWVELCDDCHGPKGNSQIDEIPSIAGIPRNYFLESIEQYTRNERIARVFVRKRTMDTDMEMIAKMLHEIDVQELADWYSLQIYRPASQPFDRHKALQGRKLHRKFCNGCHVQNGQSSKDDVPVLAGQKMGYLRQSIKDIATTKRKSGKTKKSRIDTVIERYGDEGIENLIHFYISSGV